MPVETDEDAVPGEAAVGWPVCDEAAVAQDRTAIEAAQAGKALGRTYPPEIYIVERSERRP